MGIGWFVGMGVSKRWGTLLSVPGGTLSLKSLYQGSQSAVSPCCPSSIAPAAGCALKVPSGLGFPACSFAGSLWLSMPEMESRFL